MNRILLILAVLSTFSWSCSKQPAPPSRLETESLAAVLDPGSGKLIELQVLLRGRLRTFATTHTDRRGRWHYDYRFDGTRGRQLYRFRARIPREVGYPYEPGRSRVVKIAVQGT